MGDSVLLVDGDNILMRAMHAAGQSMDHDGVNTGPVVIFMNLLARAVKDVSPDQIMVGFDHHDPLNPSLRKVLFPGYKANRKPRGDDENRSRDDIFALTRELLSALGVYHVDLPGLEADDLIASAWAWHREHSPDDEVYVYSGDKDLLQLCDEQTTVLRPTSGGLERWGPQEVLGHYHVPAHALAAYLGLVGDASDSIPGVPGVGPKKAVKMLSENAFDMVRTIDAMTDTWGPKRTSLAEVSYVLADLRTDPLAAPGIVDGEPFPDPPEMTDILADIFDRHALSRLRERVESGTLWSERGDGEEVVQQAFDDILGS